jgi:Domain of unknown function (DUF4340)
VTENAKTGIFAAAAAAIGCIAWFTMPQQITSIKENSQELINKPMFEKFTDPNAAATLKIIKFDDDLGQLKQFELARDKASGAWVIPSSDSYPADAATQVSNVANSFIDLRILTVESTKVEDQKLYGVVEPDINKLEAGDSGVGTLVEMKDDRGESLVSMIVGKTVRDDKKKRYVRRARTDAIYTAELDVEPITTDFSKWIEGDLLKLSSNDIASLGIRDYSILQTQSGPGVQKNFDADLQYSPLDAKWNAKQVRVYGPNGPTERKLTEDEELNTVKINEIKNTLDNLKIVKVARKPKGLAADLKADKELMDDNAKIVSLSKKGFLPGQGADGSMELYSTNGELAVKLNDGVEYLLRFGKTTAGESSDEEDAEKESSSGVALNRTLMVTARLDESHYPMPTLQKVPETIADLKELEARENPPQEPPANEAKSTEPPAKASSDKEPAGDKAPGDKPADDKATGDKATGDKEPTSAKEPAAPNKADQSEFDLPKLGTRLVRLQAEEEAKAGSSKEASEKAAEAKPAEKTEAKDSKPKADEKKKQPAKKKAEGKSDKKDSAKGKEPTAEQPTSEDGKKSEVKADTKSDAKAESSPEMKSDAKSEAKDAKKPAVETEEELKERLEAARERITKENTRELDERNDRINAAKKKAGELNARFADWYYEISDSEFKRLRATLDDLIKKKSAPGSTPPGPPPGGQGFPGGAPF